MPDPKITRLTITWSKDTDLALRTHLGVQGLKKGALSKFIEDAVKWRLFNQTWAKSAKRSPTFPPTSYTISSTRLLRVSATRNTGSAKAV